MFAALIALLFGGAALAFAGGAATAAPASSLPPDNDDEGDDETPAAAPLPASEDTPDLPDSAYTLDWDGLTAEEQLIVELVNRARLDPNAEVNRLNEGLASGIDPAPKQALAVLSELSDAARAHSADMDDRNFFAHTNPDGEQPWDRAVEAGHDTTHVGENIAVIGSSWTDFDEQARAEALHEGLWESDGHQRNMLSEGWTEIGTGYDYGNWEGYAGSTFVTEKFSAGPEAYLTGVVIEDADGDEFYDMGEGQGGVRITATDEANPENVYTTSTWEAGGYTLALPSGTYRVRFEGGDLDAPQEALVTIDSDNVKLDIIDETGSTGIFASATLVPEDGTEDAAMLPSLPPVEEGDTQPLDASEDEDDLEPMLL